MTLRYEKHVRINTSGLLLDGAPNENRALAPGLVVLFGAPVLRARVSDYMPAEVNADRLCDALHEDILRSWRDFLDIIGSGQHDQDLDVSALNDGYFHFQISKMTGGYGATAYRSKPRGWMAGDAGQQLLTGLTGVVADYEERLKRSALAYAQAASPAENWTAPARGEPSIDPDRLRVWASVHDCHSHHVTHTHPHGRLSGAVYLHAPRWAGRLRLYGLLD